MATTSPSQTRPTSERLPAPRGPRWARALAAVAAVAGVLGLGLTAAVLFARGALDERLARLERETGRRLVVGAVDLPLLGGVSVHGVRVTTPDRSAVQLSAEHVATDLSLARLALGERRPAQVVVSGLRGRVLVDDDGLHGLDDLLRRGQGTGGDAGESGRPRPPLSVTLVDSGVAVDLRRSDLPPLTVVLDGLQAVATLGPDRAIDATGRGRLRVAGRERAVTFRLDTAAGHASIVLDGPLEVPLAWGGHRAVLALSGASRDAAADTLRLEGVSVRTWRGTLALGAVDVRGGGGGLRPSLAALTEVAVERPSLTLGERTLQARRVSVALAAPAEGAEGLAGLPRPASMEATHVKADLPDRGVVALVDHARVRLGPDPLGAVLGGDPLGALAGVKLSSPTIRLPSPDRGLEGLAGVALGRGPAATSDGAPSSVGPGAARPGLRQRLVALLRALALEVSDGLIEVVDAKGGGVLTLDNVGLELRPAEDAGLDVEVDAMVVRDEQPTGAFELRALVDRRGRPTSARGTVAGQDFAHLLSRFSEYIEVPKEADLDVRFEYQAPRPDADGDEQAQRLHRVTGSVKAKRFGFVAWRISHAPITELKGEARFEATWDPDARHARLRVPKVTVGEARFGASLDLTLPRGGRPKIDARLSMPRQDCAAVARSIPPVLIPRLRGLEATGTMAFEARFAVDMAAPRELELAVDGDVERCTILKLSDEIDLEALRGRTYVHHPVEPDKGVREDISVGPGTAQWVPARMLPRFVKAAAVVTEDRGYWHHKGIRWQLVARALKLDLAKERFVYGGSTITQQLVKNLYLTREKTLARKLEEAIIAMQMERTFSKEEILTLYVNVVEYGPDIYGVKRASRWYFGKQPWELSPLEAAFIMGLKPWPRSGFRQWEKGQLSSYWVDRCEKILKMMHRREDAITAREVAAAAPFQPRFRRPGESFSSGASYVPPSVESAPPPTLPPPATIPE